MKNKKSILYHSVCAGLKATIVVHGPVHRKNISSAGKRIVGQLAKFESINLPDQSLKEKLSVVAAEHYHRLQNLRAQLRNPDIPQRKKILIHAETRALYPLVKDLNKLLTYNQENID